MSRFAGLKLEHHGQDVLKLIDADIAAGKIELYTDQRFLQIDRQYQIMVEYNEHLKFGKRNI